MGDCSGSDSSSASHIVLDSLYLAAAHSFDLTPEFEIPLNSPVIQNTEAVNDGDGTTGHLHDFFRSKMQVGFVPHGEHNGIGTLEGRINIFLYPEIIELSLITEKAGPRVPRSGISFLLLELPPVFHVGVMDHDFGTHLSEFAHNEL